MLLDIFGVPSTPATRRLYSPTTDPATPASSRTASRSGSAGHRPRDRSPARGRTTRTGSPGRSVPPATCRGRCRRPDRPGSPGCRTRRAGRRPPTRSVPACRRGARPSARSLPRSASPPASRRPAPRPRRRTRTARGSTPPGGRRSPPEPHPSVAVPGADSGSRSVRRITTVRRAASSTYPSSK
jgi:hypothetical protein